MRRTLCRTAATPSERGRARLRRSSRASCRACMPAASRSSSRCRPRLLQLAACIANSSINAVCVESFNHSDGSILWATLLLPETCLRWIERSPVQAERCRLFEAPQHRTAIAHIKTTFFVRPWMKCYAWPCLTLRSFTVASITCQCEAGTATATAGAGRILLHCGG